MKNPARRALTPLIALALTATACADAVQPAPASPAPPVDRADLASVAVDALVQSRDGGFHIVIPDETRTGSEAVVLYMHGTVTDRYRFVRHADGWALDRRLDRVQEPAANAGGPLLDRGTWSNSSNVPNGTPPFALTTFSWPDGTFPVNVTLYPVRYTYGGAAYRWTQSAEVVAGYEDPAKQPNAAAFDYNGFNLQWRTADSVFTVDAYRKWVFGDGERTLRTCNLAGISASTVCSAGGLIFSQVPAWADGYYHITVEKRNPSSVSISPTSLTVVPGQTAQLTATVRDQYSLVMPAPVTWSSSNTAVATVSSTGLVTSNTFGSAVITATTTGGVSATVTVQASASVTLTGPPSIFEGWTYATASVAPTGSYYYVWSYDRCDYRETEFQCFFGQPLPSGQNVTSASIYVSKYDSFVRYRVSVKATATSTGLGSAELKVNGGNQVFESEEGCANSRFCE